MDAYQDEAIQRWHVRRADSVAEAREWVAGWPGEWAAEAGAHWAVPAARGKGVGPRAVDAMAS
jgi:[ribosomal protein S5]-alanine N-acetyltransferase